MLGEAFLPITPSLPVSAPVAVEVAPVVTAPVVAEAPAVTTTQPVPADTNAPVVPDTSEQNQRLFLPIITNVSALAGAALGSPVGIGVTLVVLLVLLGVIIGQRRARRG